MVAAGADILVAGSAIFGAPIRSGPRAAARPRRAVRRVTRRPVSDRRSSVSIVRVRYAETDKMGVVYYANYFVWFEVARADLLRTLGWSYREMEQAGVSLPVIDAHCQYHRPARYDDELEVRTEGAPAVEGADGVRLPGRPPRRPVAGGVGPDRSRGAGSDRQAVPAA